MGQLWDEVFALVASNAVTYRALETERSSAGSGFSRKCNIGKLPRVRPISNGAN